MVRKNIHKDIKKKRTDRDGTVITETSNLFAHNVTIALLKKFEERGYCKCGDDGGGNVTLKLQKGFWNSMSLDRISEKECCHFYKDDVTANINFFPQILNNRAGLISSRGKGTREFIINEKKRCENQDNTDMVRYIIARYAEKENDNQSAAYVSINNAWYYENKKLIERGGDLTDLPCSSLCDFFICV